MKKQVDIRKTAAYSVVINGVQIAAVMAIALYLLLSGEQVVYQSVIRIGITVAALIVSLGAVVDIRDALGTNKALDRVVSMEQSVSELEELNNTLRAQRHDFLNHLQVVYSLMEMQEYKDAQDYIERVYGDIRAVSRVLRTANPTVNALLKVKLAACERQGVKAEMHIASAWKNLSIPGWEMCKVLANLIDNALDAMKGTKDPRLTITLSEDLKTFHFSVANNGPDIPPQDLNRIFQPGVTTKSEGHGMGLFIVRNTLRENGGDIEVTSGGETVFSGFVPKGTAAADDPEIS
jgi:sensor histidine kinase regulating citrate/malate metabolism